MAQGKLKPVLSPRLDGTSPEILMAFLEIVTPKMTELIAHFLPV